MEAEKMFAYTPGPRVVYEAMPNDANDKRAYGSWKVCVREFDADGLMVRAQKYAQEIYSEAHALKIASALNEDAAAPDMLAALKQIVAENPCVRRIGCPECTARPAILKATGGSK